MFSADIYQTAAWLFSIHIDLADLTDIQYFSDICHLHIFNATVTGTYDVTGIDHIPERDSLRQQKAAAPVSI